jgi:uncharacterized membrane protein
VSTLPEAAAASERVPGPRSGARRPLPAPPATIDPTGLRRRVRASVLGPWALAAIFAVVYAFDSVERYAQFRTVSWDLGLFTEAVKQYAHLHAPIVDARGPGFDLLGEHFHPILALLGPFFAIKPSPVTLLLAQALLFASSIVPVTSLARERLGSRAGYVVGAAYGASFGLVQAVDFDFHELAFAAPLIALALLALLRDRDRLLIAACVGLLCTKEEFGVTVVLPLGLAWMLRDRARWRRRLPLAVLGVVASMVQIFWLIPALNPNHVYGFLTGVGTAGSEGNAEGLGQLFADLGGKIHLLVLLGLATAFASLLSPLALLAIPDLLMRFASSDTAYWGTLYHYNSVLMPILFVAAIDGLSRHQVSRRLQLLGVSAIGLAALGMQSDYGLGETFAQRQYAPSPLHIQALRDAIHEIPDGVSVESGISTLAPLAAKADVFWIGNTASDPAPAYIVYDTLTSGEPLTPGQMVQLAEAWHPLTVYALLSSEDGVYVLRQH